MMRRKVLFFICKVGLQITHITKPMVQFRAKVLSFCELENSGDHTAKKIVH